MKLNVIIYIINLYLLSQILCDLPTFEIKQIHHESTRCEQQKGYFQFVLEGDGKGIQNTISITLPLKSPPSCNAECEVSSTEMLCKIDAKKYDLSGRKMVEVFENEPNFGNLKILNWEQYFIFERRIINHATNCDSSERKDDPEKSEEYIFEAKNIEILGCFRNKNNFSFQLTKIKDENTILQDDLDQDIYFEIIFEKPENEKALCVIPKKNDNGVYKARCAIKYGGEIIVGKEATGAVKKEEKTLKIVFKGSLIPPTNVDECRNDDKILENK